MPEDTFRHHTPTVFQIGHWRFDTTSRDLTDGVRTRRLTPKAAAVLTALVDAGGHVMTRIELLDRVWPDVDVCEEVLTHSVAEIRRSMGGKDARRTIETVHGTGYRLRASIRAVQDDEPPQSAAVDEEFCLEAYLDYVDARRLCEREGERALGKAVELCGAAAARAPRCASILAEFAALTAMRRLYCESGGPELEDALKRCRHCDQSTAASRLRSCFTGRSPCRSWPQLRCVYRLQQRDSARSAGLSGPLPLCAGALCLPRPAPGRQDGRTRR